MSVAWHTVRGLSSTGHPLLRGADPLDPELQAFRYMDTVGRQQTLVAMFLINEYLLLARQG